MTCTAIVFCVAEGLVVLITTCPLSGFNHNRLQGMLVISANKKKQLEMKNKGGG